MEAKLPNNNFINKPETKRILPPKARDYLDLVQACYKAGFKPMSKAMKEASRQWKVKKQV